jgi:hypothetical protein
MLFERVNREFGLLIKPFEGVADLGLSLSSFTGVKFDHVMGFANDFADAPRFEVVGDVNDFVGFGDKDYINREAHKKAVDAVVRDDDQAFTGGKLFAPHQTEKTGPSGVGDCAGLH